MGKFSVLKGEKDYMKRLIAQAATRLADSIDQLTFSWIMYEITGKASLAALFLFFNFLPSTLFQPFLGVIVERIHKKHAIIFCDIGRAVVVSFTFLAYFLGWLNAGWLIGMTLVISTLEAIGHPANASILPFLLDESKYEAGTALNNSMSRVAELVGTGVAGILIGTFGATGALIVDGLFFLLSALVTTTIKSSETITKTALHIKGFFKEFRQGFQMLKGLKTVCLFMIVAAFLNFCISPINAFQSAYVVDSLHFGAEMVSVIGVALTLGLGIGALITPKLSDRFSPRTLFLMSGFMQIAAMLAYWGIPNIGNAPLKAVFISLAAFILGLGIGFISVIVSTKMIAGIPKDFLARIMSISSSVATLMIPGGALICSGLTLMMPVPQIYLLFAIVMLLFYIILSRLRTLRQL